MIAQLRRRHWREPLTAICLVFMVLQPVLGQEPAGQRNLRIAVVEGEGNKNVVLQIAPRPLVVRVLGGENLPVPGATVVFSAPAVGAGGQFSNDSRVMTVTTDQDGLASAGTFHPNSTGGSYQIRVTAEIQGQSAIATINQTNIEGKKGHGKWIAVGAIAAAAGVAAIAFKGKDSNGNPGPVAPTITFGGAAVGAPR